MVWSRVHVLYSSLLNLYSPLIAEMLVSALQSFLNLGTLQQRSFYTVTGILGTLLYSLSWSSNQCMWLRDSAIIVYILCSGSYLADLTCKCACMFTSLHVAPVPLKVGSHSCVTVRGEKPSKPHNCMCKLSHVWLYPSKVWVFRETPIKNNCCIVAALHAVTWMN